MLLNITSSSSIARTTLFGNPGLDTYIINIPIYAYTISPGALASSIFTLYWNDGSDKQKSYLLNLLLNNSENYSFTALIPPSSYIDYSVTLIGIATYGLAMGFDSSV